LIPLLTINHHLNYWNNGQQYNHLRACKDYFDMTCIPLSEALKDLFRRRFKEDEDERPHDFAEVEKALLTIYREETGKDYWRPLPKAAADTADSLNNHVLSFLDLEMPEKAEEYWEKALEKQPEGVKAKLKKLNV
jgi:hypothetical protein